MLFSQFSQFLLDLEQTSSRLDMTSQLAKLFKQLSQEEDSIDLASQEFTPDPDNYQQFSQIRMAAYLMQGRLVPKYQSLEFNLSSKMLIRVLARLAQEIVKNTDKLEQEGELSLFGQDNSVSLEKKVKQSYKDLGDLGLVAERLIEDKQQYEQLELRQVYLQLREIAQDGGSGSQERKVTALKQLLAKVDKVSARYIVRIVIGKLRLGFASMTILDALSWAIQEDKSASKKLEQAYQKKADIGLLAEAYLLAADQDKRQELLADYSVEISVPVMPALCQRLESYQEMVEKLGEMYAEPKYDGLRVQIHIKDGQAWAFTRNLEDASHMFPELSEVAKQIGQSCILDCEAVGIDKDSGKILSFQKTITRKRKHGIDKQAAAIPIRFYVFDILALADKSLLNEPLSKRKELLADLFENNQLLFKTPYIKTKDAKKLEAYHKQQLAAGREGAVMKQVDGLYRSGRKGWRWVKIKEKAGTKGKLSDTLDLVVMGYYSGKGKRTSFGLGAFLVGVLSDEKIKTVAKIGTGLTDEQLKELKKRCDQIEVKSKPNNYQVNKSLNPDVWVQASLVVEIAADEITDSPIHTAGKALRFPRLVKFRDDKDWQQATTLEEIKQMAG